MFKCILKTLTLVILYTLLYLVVYVIHINFFEINVIFYAAIFDAILSAVIFEIMFILSPWRKLFTELEVFQTFLIFILIGYATSARHDLEKSQRQLQKSLKSSNAYEKRNAELEKKNGSGWGFGKKPKKYNPDEDEEEGGKKKRRFCVIS